jgi:NADPH2:quinone reductase
MKAWLLDRLEGIDHLRLADVPDPQPAAGEAVLDVLYAALNPADRYLAEAQYPAKPPLPHILGRDGVGVVRAVAPGVTGVRVDDTCALLRGAAGVDRAGSFAQQIAVPVDSLVPVPQGWTLEQASCATLVYLTAYQAISQWADLPAKANVLITGASGGVGVASTQLAKAMGHTVLALSRSDEKQRHLKDLGAAAAFDPTDENWWRTLREFLGGPKVDLAIDNIGGALFNLVVSTLGMHGRVSCVGRLAGPVPDFNTATLFFRRIRIGGVAVGSYSRDEAHAAWNNILALLDRTGARPLIDRVFPFEQLPQAFQRLAEGPMGKVLVKVAER